jgi:hypothetical protein
MTVDETRFMPQNAEPPDAETSRGPKLINCRDEAAENGKPSLDPFSAHLLGRSKRGVSVSQNDNATSGRSPSDWHDDTTGRDAGHDAMQLDLWRFLNHQRVERKEFSNSGQIIDCQAEVPIIDPRSGRVLAFADIGVQHRHPVTGEEYWRFMELKPRIYSCGGLIRQCRAIQIAAERGGLGSCRVTAVVFKNDPKIEMLREMYPDVMGWVNAPARSAAA